MQRTSSTRLLGLFVGLSLCLCVCVCLRTTSVEESIIKSVNCKYELLLLSLPTYCVFSQVLFVWMIFFFYNLNTAAIRVSNWGLPFCTFVIKGSSSQEMKLWITSILWFQKCRCQGPQITATTLPTFGNVTFWWLLISFLCSSKCWPTVILSESKDQIVISDTFFSLLLFFLYM